MENKSFRKLPDPSLKYPRPGETTTVYLKNVISKPNIVVGDFTIYHDFEDPCAFERKNVLYHYPCNKERLVIGKFSSIANGARFIMNGANHKVGAVSTYPFAVLGPDWDPSLSAPQAWDIKGDTVIGNDVWIGFEAVIMPGVHIGDGAIVATRAVVSRDVAPYEIVGGVPAKTIRSRFKPETVKELLRLRWWDWEPARIQANLDILRGDDPSALSRIPLIEPV